jgi:hypothetical protein
MVIGVHEFCMLSDVTELDCVDEIIDYQSNAADKSVLLKDNYRTQRFRPYYLRNLRFEWEWVDDSDTGKAFVLLKAR